MADRFVDTPPAGADAWREVWADDRLYRPRPSRYEGLLRFVRRLVRRASEPDAERQKNFNLVLLELMRDLRGDAEALRRDLRAEIDAVHQAALTAIDETRKLRELLMVAARRNDALVAAVDQKIETVAVRLRDATNPAVSPSADVLYRRMEDALRGGEAEVRADVAHYVRLAAEQQPLLDVGCGRGELLQSCRDAGIVARGVDTNERSVADLRRRGFEVEQAAVPGCFQGVGDGSLGSIAAIHVVEHLPVEALFALFREAARTLRGGGLLMIETPNAESVAFAASDFWRDPTHLAPRHAAALTVLAREHGFDLVECRAVHEQPEGAKLPVRETDPPELQRAIHAVNDRFFAPVDLRLVLQKPPRPA